MSKYRFLNNGIRANVEICVPTPNVGVKKHNINPMLDFELAQTLVKLFGLSQLGEKIEVTDIVEEQLIELGVLLEESNKRPKFAKKITHEELCELDEDSLVIQLDKNSDAPVPFKANNIVSISDSLPILWGRSVNSNLYLPYSLDEKDTKLFTSQGLEYFKGLVKEGSKSKQVKTTSLEGDLKNDGCVLIRELFDGEYASYLQDYYFELDRKGYFETSDWFVRERNSYHNEAFASVLHSCLTETVSNMVGRELKPSYNYLSMYKEGAELGKHTDREQCEWNLSIQLGAVDGTSAWPFYVQHNEKINEINMELGDAVLFSGKEKLHWREPLKSGRVLQLICHFVDVNFQGSLN